MAVAPGKQRDVILYGHAARTRAGQVLAVGWDPRVLDHHRGGGEIGLVMAAEYAADPGRQTAQRLGQRRLRLEVGDRDAGTVTMQVAGRSQAAAMLAEAHNGNGKVTQAVGGG